MAKVSDVETKKEEPKKKSKGCCHWFYKLISSIIIFISGFILALFLVYKSLGYTFYHFRFRIFITLIGWKNRDKSTGFCYDHNKEIISCELLGLTKIIQLRWTKQLKYHTYNLSDTIIPYSRNNMDTLWNVNFPFPTQLPVSIVFDHLMNQDSMWILHNNYYKNNKEIIGSKPDYSKLKETGIIISIHGGAFVMGDMTHLKSFLSHISAYTNNGNIPVFAFNYRLAPECEWPCSVQDSMEMIYLYFHKTLQIPLNKIFLIGDSAGAHISLLLMQKIAFINRHEDDIKKHRFAGAVLISPGLDWSLSAKSWDNNANYDPILLKDNIALYRNYVFGIYETDSNGNRIIRKNDIKHDSDTCASIEKNLNFKDPKISPLYGEFNNLSPTMITISQHECIYDDSIKLYQKMRNAGVNVKLRIDYGSAIHELPLFAGVINEANIALNDITKFIENVMT